MLTKNIRPFLVTLFISIISFGNIHAYAGVDGSPFEGLYLGVITTKNTFSSTPSFASVPAVDVNTELVIPNLFNGITSINHNNSYGSGILGGYGLNMGIFYAGVEAAFIIDKGNTVISDGTNTYKISKSNTMDINLRGGITLSNKALIFGLIGYSGAVLKSNGVNNNLIETEGASYNKRITSFRLGAGVEVAVFENIALRLEYTQSRFGTTTIINDSDQFSFKPKTSRIMASFILHMY